jgi:DNA-binding NtrC family response regulator
MYDGACILVVDDTQDFLDSQRDSLELAGYRVLCAATKREGRNLLASNARSIEIALIDMDMEDDPEAGLEFVRLIGAEYPQIVPIVITGKGETRNAVRSMEEGAFTYILKGEAQREVILMFVRKGIEHHRFLRRLTESYDRAEENITELQKALSNMKETVQRLGDEAAAFTRHGLRS